MKIQEIRNLFEFVVTEVDRLSALRQTDWKQAAKEVGLNRGLPRKYDDFCHDYYECGRAASHQMYKMAVARLRATPSLSGRVKVETFLKPIEVELAQRAVARRPKIDDALVKAILREAESRALTTLEDRTYFFPVYTIDVKEIDAYTFGPVHFVRMQKFFADHEINLKQSEKFTVKSLTKSDDPEEIETHTVHIAKLFKIAREHYGNFRWIAAVHINGAEPDVGREKAEEVLEQTLGLLRLSTPSRDGQFIGLIQENPMLRLASYLSLKTTNEFHVSCSSSYGEPPATVDFLEDYRRKVPYLRNLEGILLKVQQWQQTDEIENRLLAALFWFNEGWKETRMQPKIVKFSICVECLFSTARDHEAIAERCSERLAWLSYPGGDDWHERRETYRVMKSVYGARSKAVHGDSSVAELDLAMLARQAEEQASLGIFAFAQLAPLFHSKANKDALLTEFFVRLKLEGLERAREIFAEGPESR